MSWYLNIVQLVNNMERERVRRRGERGQAENEQGGIC